MIVALCSDLLFGSKISQTAKELNLEAVVVKSVEELKESILMKGATVAIVDLNMKSSEPFEAIRFLKEYDQSNFGAHPIQSYGFFAHVDKNIEERAKREGLKNVLSRSVFVKKLTAILSGQFE